MAEQYDPNEILRKVLVDYPGLANTFNLENTGVMFATPERVKAAGEAYGRTSPLGGIEYWPAEEPGFLPSFPHPTEGGKNILEIYSDDIKSNPENLYKAVYGDLMHGMSKDPNWAKLRDEFKKNYTPEERKRMSMKRSWWEDANGQNANDMAIHDAYIRGWLNERDVAEKGQKENKGTMYSPKQLELLNAMEKYLKTGK